MPGNEVEDGIHNLYELDNSSWGGQHLSQAVGGNWPVLDYNQWVERPAQIGTPPNFNLNNYSLHKLDSAKGCVSESLHVPFNENYAQLTPRPEYSRSLHLNNLLNTNEFLDRCQNLHSKQNQPGNFGEIDCYDQRILTSRGFPILKSPHENECADSPTLTTNSERSEITEASSDFNFLIGQQQFARDQELCAPQISPMQQPGYNDMQLLQQHMMFKQLQEFQRQQQLQQLGDLRQQNSLNQFSAISRQATAGQFSPLVNGTPVHDASQMLRNWMQRGASPAAQGVTNKVVFSQEQGQALHSMGLTPPQLDVSLYGTPVSNTRGNMSQYPHLQGLSSDSVNLLAKASALAQKPIMQSSGFGNPYLGDQPAPDLVGLSQGPFISKQEVQMKNNFGQVSVQGLNSGVFTGNIQEDNTPQVNTSVKELTGRHEQAGWSAMQQTKQLSSSQGLVPLDPMEAKILYNMDDNIWDAFGSRTDAGAGSLSNTLEHPDSSYAFPSIQSGSWSALMQSAVAEASSSDTGLQEEWSGLTFQNTEHSTDNQMSNFVDGDKQQTGWVDNNLQSASSFSSKPFPMITDSSMSTGFPGFQQPGIQLSVGQREDICQDGSHESIENGTLQQKPSVQHGQKVQTIIHPDNAWAGQMFDHSHTSQHQKGSSSDISLDNKGSKSIAKSQHQMSNGPHVAPNSYEGTNDTHEMQQNYLQRENSIDCSRGSSSHEHGHVEQFKFFGNVSSGAMSLDKASLTNYQGSSRASEEVLSAGDHSSNASATFRGLALDGSNMTAQTSEHMLKLLHKVDRSKDDSTIKQFGSTNCNPLAEMSKADSHDTSVAQMYAQSSASQGFGLRLAPPSQRLTGSNSFLTPLDMQQTTSNLNSRQVNSEVEEKNQACLAPSSFQSSPPSHELSQRAHWDNKSGTVGQTSFSSNFNMQGNSVLPFSPNLTQARSQLQMRSLSNVPITSQSLQAALPGATARFPPFNQVLAQDTSQQIYSGAGNQQFPVLDSSPKYQPPNMSAQSQQGENSTRPYNVWRNVPTQRQTFGVEPLKFSGSPSSMGPTNSSPLSTSQAHGSHDDNSIKGGYKSLEVGASSDSQVFDCKEGHHGKETLQRRIPSKVLDTSLSGGASQGQEQVLDTTALSSGLVSDAHQQEQDLDKARHNNNVAQASSERNLESSSHSHDDHHSDSLLNQVQAKNDGAGSALGVQSATALGGQQLHDNARFRHPMDSEPNLTSLPNSFPSRDEMLGFPAEAIENLPAKAPFHTALQSRPSQEMPGFGYNDSHAQSSSSRMLSNHTEHGHVNLHMANSWFKQYGALRNGQMAPVFDARLATAAALQLKPSQNLHIHPPLERLDAADAGRDGRVWPSAAAALLASQKLASPYMLPSEVANRVAIMRPKKRKIATVDIIPWHKEVTQSSKRLQNISAAEQEWAQATNRLIEKVEDEAEVTGEQPVHRSKRRLVLTTQLVQQLFRPAPASIFSADSASNYSIISYFISRLSLGDACSLAYHARNDFLKPVNNDNMNSQKSKISESSGDLQLLEVVEGFIDRANKLNNDFQRLDRAASVVDIRGEFQELERYAVINRFAKFHVRGQVDPSGTSSSSAALKPVPQRHIIAFPMPRNLPEGVQCLSL